MYACEGRFCSLEELTTNNDELLFGLMKEHVDEYRLYVSDEPVPPTLQDFKRSLALWFSGGRLYQFLVSPRHKKLVIGTIFFYSYRPHLRTIKCSCFYIPSVRRSICVAESLGMSMRFARSIIGAEEILFSVYSNNKSMVSFAQKLGAEPIKEEDSAMNPDRRVFVYHLSSRVLDVLEMKLQRFHR